MCAVFNGDDDENIIFFDVYFIFAVFQNDLGVFKNGSAPVKGDWVCWPDDGLSGHRLEF